MDCNARLGVKTNTAPEKHHIAETPQRCIRCMWEKNDIQAVRPEISNVGKYESPR